ncbi:MAG TPA: phosphoglycerate kinase [Candidatus Eisenbacteria bacterium]|nr:phosphoglycerate kinase [Candidatus Eisenbacteria bacterium]
MRFAKKTVRDLECDGRRVLVRVDYNVPVAGGEVTDDTRIAASMPTLRYLLQKGARLVLMSHLGRPKGGPDPRASLRPVRTRLARLLRQDVAWADDCVGAAAEAAAGALAPGGVLLLENLRFHAEEEKNDPGFSQALARLGDAYVNDAFGTAHRAHASTVGVTRHLHPAVAGFLMQKELDYLGRALEQPRRPFVAVLGGAKISGKIDVITALLARVDRLLVGGAMMFTFLKARGRSVGRSLVEDDRLEAARAVLADAARRNVELVLPVDCLAATAPDGSAPARVRAVEQIAADEMGVDIGPQTVSLFAGKLADAKTVVWNGPMGIFEVPAFATGTLAVAAACAPLREQGAVTVVGGGDSVAAVQQSGLGERFSHLSTGGGATLEFLEGRELPGVAALDDGTPA